MKKISLFLGIAMLLIVMMLAACDQKIVFVGSSSNSKNKITASYRVFTGTEEKKVNLKSGEILAIDYQSEVTEGDLTINLYDPDDQLLQGLSTNESGSEKIEASKDGMYRIEITGNNTKGSYEIVYDVESPDSGK